ncbi:VOC family protein [Oricola thermophila]|uniref:VOC family protein n=1 Tax=Oricola thermophila TaxID=2742145 RepID=A0A6N1VGY3_9HYPH|nr:VOC family protein [Oricola thermophila]QKV20160.1 VOC family protein [Oricola thermophila]
MSYLVNTIGHVQLNVTVREALVEEATNVLGLHVTRNDDTATWLSSNGREAELVLHDFEENSVRSVGFEAVSEAAVEEAARRIPAVGCRIVSERPSLDCCAAGVVFVTPQGHTFEIHTPVKDDITRRRHYGAGVGPLRLDHVNITSPEPAETRAQLQEIMGLKLSERMVDDGLSWMRGGNRLHHILGIVRGDTGLHHYSFELAEFSDYCRLGDRLDQIDKEFIWGPGRHRPGDNTYAYYVDACGAMVECSGGMAAIADDEAFEPNVITALKRPENVRVMNVWGTPAPAVWLEHKFPFARPAA